MKETRFFTVPKLPVSGGKTFDWTVDGEEMVLFAPTEKKKGDSHEFSYVAEPKVDASKFHKSTLTQAPPGTRAYLRLLFDI